MSRRIRVNTCKKCNSFMHSTKHHGDGVIISCRHTCGSKRKLSLCCGCEATQKYIKHLKKNAHKNVVCEICRKEGDTSIDGHANYYCGSCVAKSMTLDSEISFLQGQLEAGRTLLARLGSDNFVPNAIVRHTLDKYLQEVGVKLIKLTGKRFKKNEKEG